MRGVAMTALALVKDAGDADLGGRDRARSAHVDDAGFCPDAAAAGEADESRHAANPMRRHREYTRGA